MPRPSPSMIPALRLCGPAPDAVDRQHPAAAGSRTNTPSASSARPPARPALRWPSDARPETIYRVERRVVPGRCLLPATDLFVSALDRLVERRPIELFGYALHGQGYTLLVRALDDRLPAALRDLHSGLARQLNTRRETHGALWAGRATYRSMRHHAESVAALVDILVEPVLRGAVEHPGQAGATNTYGVLVGGLRAVRRGAPLGGQPGGGPPHTTLPWFGTLDARAVADRLDGAVEARLAAARAWALAG